MQAFTMENENGHRSENHYIIQDNHDNLFLQSYGEIVAIRHSNIIYLKVGGLERSRTTSKYIRLFIERYTNATHSRVEHVDNIVFESMEESL